jgi:hypothetical protein
MKAVRFITVSALCAACGGTSDAVSPADPPAVCTLNAVAGIVVTTIDSITGQPIQALAQVIAQDGAFSDKAVALPPQYYAAYERPGTYLVSVTLAGYRLWQQPNVVVQRGQCHVTSSQLTARLVH